MSGVGYGGLGGRGLFKHLSSHPVPQACSWKTGKINRNLQYGSGKPSGGGQFYALQA